MANFVRAALVVVIGVWTLATLTPELSCLQHRCPANGLTADFDGVVSGVEPASAAAAAGIVPGDRIVPPLPRDLFHDPPPTLSFQLNHAGSVRAVTVVPVPVALSFGQKVRLVALYASYLIFLVVGSAVLLMRPSAMTWAFYLYCVLRRYGDIWFYWPGSSTLYWFNFMAFAVLGGASCALVMIFALRFPNNRIDGWRRTLNRLALTLAVLLPAAWLATIVRIFFLGQPSQTMVESLIVVTSIVYLGAAAIFVVTLVQSRGDERQRMQWILVFPAVLVLRIVAINIPASILPWFSDVLLGLQVCIPLTVAYAVVRRHVFDIEFAISRALVYGTITTIVAGTFLLLDWFMSKQFAETRFTLTAEIIVALAIGSWLNMLHHNVDRFVDATFFRQRHAAEKRLKRAAAAVVRAESHEAVDRFLVHEPLEALALVSAAVFHRDGDRKQYVREVAFGWDAGSVKELTPEDPLVLHLLAEGATVRLADVTWTAETAPALGNALIAMPVLLRDELISIVLYGAHRSGADIDPDELRSLDVLVERAGAAYDHIEARSLRAQVESLERERREREREIEVLRARLQLAPRE